MKTVLYLTKMSGIMSEMNKELPQPPMYLSEMIVKRPGLEMYQIRMNGKQSGLRICPIEISEVFQNLGGIQVRDITGGKSTKEQMEGGRAIKGGRARRRTGNSA